MALMKMETSLFENIMFMFLFLLILLFMGEVRIASLNVNGARDPLKRAELYELLKVKRLDVALLQETHSDLVNAAEWGLEWAGLSLLSHNTSVSGGVAILFANNFMPISYELLEVIPGRLLKVRALFENHVLNIICVYAPTNASERVGFLSQLSTLIAGCSSDEYLFVGGDYNCTESDIDRNHSEPHMLSRRTLIQCIHTHDLSDVWRTIHREQRQYTWTHTHSNMISMARLDRFYCYKHHLNIFRNCVIVPVGFSDHWLLYCSVTLKDVKPKSAYWHFNSSLVHDKHFKEVFKTFWADFKGSKSSFVSLQQWWDVGKIQIQQLCKQYTQNITRDRAQSIDILEKELKEIQMLAFSTGNEDEINDLAKKKNALTELLGISAKGALVRSRFRGVEQMDVPSKYFFSLEKKNGQKRFIHALKSQSGALLTDDVEIRKRATQFYQDLYRSELKDGGSDGLFLSNLPQVAVESIPELDAVLTLGELEKALQGMECGKAPGLDGIPVDFYKCFWSEIGEDLLAVLSDSVTRGRLPVSCRRAVLTLLPKKGDLTDIRCWRPVSLLCSDFKLLSKVLASRLSKVMDQVIHPDQSYCVPGRSIFDNVSLIRDMIHVSKHLGIDLGLVSLDQTKAFDLVEFKYLWDTLLAFGFSESFVNMIRVLYNDVESILKINGGLSAPFKVGRGIRQGCSLSGMLYSLAIEPLLNKLRGALSGVVLPEFINPIRLSAYADDLVLMVRGDRDIEVTIKILKDFNTVSSARVNWAKSEALLLGQWADGAPTLPDGLCWKKDGFKYLGVFLGNDIVMQKNWEGMAESVNGRLEKWKWLLPKMSYRGRVLIINNLVASSLWHRLACVDPPPDLLNKLQSVVVNFFWDNYHWVPQPILFLPKDEGGHGLINFHSRTAAFRLQFVKKLLTGPTVVAWKLLSCTVLRTCAGLGLDKSLFLTVPQRVDCSKMPPFYRTTLKIWGLFHIQGQKQTNSLHWLLQQPVVGGARMDVSLSDFPTFQRRLLDSKIVTLKDVVIRAGAEFKDVRSFADSMGLRCTRVASKLLDKWRTSCTAEESKLLKDYSAGVAHPDEFDEFPDLSLSPILDESSGSCSKPNLPGLTLSGASGKQLYNACVKVLNKKCLASRVDTPWRNVLKLSVNVKPEWRALYKPPLPKKLGDLQWRILHGAIAVNTFVSVLNPTVGQECPFCYQRESVFHAFLQCTRLRPLFASLEQFFDHCNEEFSAETFILGFRYVKRKQNVCRLINFILGEAKMAIYVTRRNRVEEIPGTELSDVFPSLVKSRVLVDFRFFKLMNDLETFEARWCYKNALCSVLNEELHFSYFL